MSMGFGNSMNRVMGSGRTNNRKVEKKRMRRTTGKGGNWSSQYHDTTEPMAGYVYKAPRPPRG